MKNILRYLLQLFNDCRYEKISLGIILHNANQLLKQITEATTKILIDLVNFSEKDYRLHEWSMMQLLKSSVLAELPVEENTMFYRILNDFLADIANTSILKNKVNCMFDLCIVQQESLVDTLNEVFKDDPYYKNENEIKRNSCL